MTSLFISYAAADRITARALQRQMRAAGLPATFLDVDPATGVEAGKAWERELYAALRRCDAVVFLSSAASVASRWCFAEIVLARSTGKPVFPVRVDGGPRLDLVGALQEVEFGDGDMVARLVDGLRGMGLDPADAFAWDRTQSPYPGLSAFAADDAAVFFGRTEETAHVLDLLQPALVRGAGRWVGVVGPSGSGKSSLLLAGVLPRLGLRPERWVVLPPFVPGSRPLRSLAFAISRALSAHGVAAEPAAVEREIDDPVTGPDGFRSRLHQLREFAGGSADVLVTIDQAEELLLRTGPRERADFLALLTGSLGDGSPLWVLSTMRSEYLGTAPERAALTEAIDDQVVVGPLNRSRLSEVIARPAQRAGLRFDPGLIERMAGETRGGDALPLLAYTLQELAAHAGRDDTVTIAAYERLGGVAGVIRTRADLLSAELHRRGLGPTVLPTLLRLAGVDDDGRPVRREVPIARFRPDERTVVEAFVDARLLVSSADRAVLGIGAGDPQGTGTEVVEVAHEALLRQWSPLRDLIDEKRPTLRNRGDLERQAADWEHGGRDPSYLLRGVRLAALAAWADEQPDEVAGREREFLDESRAAGEEELERTRRTNRILRWLAAGLAVLLVVALVTGVVAVQQGARARDEAAVALGRQLLAQAALVRDTQPDLSLLLSVEAWHRSTGDGREEARTALLDGLNRSFHASTVLDGHEAAVGAVAVRPDGGAVATEAEDGTLRLFDPGTGRLLVEPVPIGSEEVTSVAFTADGSVLAAAAGSEIRLVRTDNGQPAVSVLKGHRDVVYRVAFSQDGTLLASASGDGTVRLWNVATGTPRGEPLTGHEDVVFDVAISPDGATVASASWDGSVRLWDAATGTSRAELEHDGEVATLAFGPGGDVLASGGDDAMVRLWDVASGTLRHELNGHEGSITSLTFSPDGAVLASGSEDRTVRLWDVTAGTARGGALVGHDGVVVDVAFTDGATVASAGADATVRLWDVATGTQSGVPLAGHKGSITDLSVSGDGAILATGSADGTARVWSVGATESPVKRALPGAGTPLHKLAIGPDGTVVAAGGNGEVLSWAGLDAAGPRRLGGLGATADAVAAGAGGVVAAGGEGPEVRVWPPGNEVGVPIPVAAGVRDLAFSPDGTLLAVACVDATVRLFDVRTYALRTELRGHSAPVDAVAFGPSGVLASGGEDGTVRLTDVDTSQAIGEPHEVPGWVLDLTFSADGTTLASAGADGTVRLWDGVTGAPRETPPVGQRGWIYTVAFRPDAAVLASGADDGAQVWEVATGRPAGRPLVQGQGRVTAIAFEGDGSMVTLTGGTAWRWDLDAAHLLAAACRVARRDLTTAERLTYLGSDPAPAPTCA